MCETRKEGIIPSPCVQQTLHLPVSYPCEFPVCVPFFSWSMGVHKKSLSGVVKKKVKCMLVTFNRLAARYV